MIIRTILFNRNHFFHWFAWLLSQFMTFGDLLAPHFPRINTFGPDFGLKCDLIIWLCFKPPGRYSKPLMLVRSFIFLIVVCHVISWILSVCSFVAWFVLSFVRSSVSHSGSLVRLDFSFFLYSVAHSPITFNSEPQCNRLFHAERSINGSPMRDREKRAEWKSEREKTSKKTRNQRSDALRLTDWERWKIQASVKWGLM